MKSHSLFFPLCFSAGLLASAALSAQETNSAPDLVNTSARTVLTPENPMFLSGFVLHGGGEAGAKRWVLIRVVGPSLAGLGVPNPLRQPSANLHGQNGEPKRLGYEHRVFPQIVYPDGTTPESRFRAALRRASEASGATPVPIPDVGQPVPDDHDVVDLVELGAGAYTVQIQSRVAAQSGTALVETFVLPADFDPQLKPEGVE